jgi:hypothetical protein
MKKQYQVVDSFENEQSNRCVDIIQDQEGRFRYQEWRREPEDLAGWFLMRDSQPESFASARQATLAAQKFITWFIPINTD